MSTGFSAAGNACSYLCMRADSTQTACHAFVDVRFGARRATRASPDCDSVARRPGALPFAAMHWACRRRTTRRIPAFRCVGAPGGSDSLHREARFRNSGEIGPACSGSIGCFAGFPCEQTDRRKTLQRDLLAPCGMTCMPRAKPKPYPRGTARREATCIRSGHRIKSLKDHDDVIYFAQPPASAPPGVPAE